MTNCYLSLHYSYTTYSSYKRMHMYCIDMHMYEYIVYMHMPRIYTAKRN